MNSSHRITSGRQSKLVSATSRDEHAKQLDADRRFQAALDYAIAIGSERLEAARATVQLRRPTRLSLYQAAAQPEGGDSAGIFARSPGRWVAAQCNSGVPRLFPVPKIFDHLPHIRNG